MHRCFGCWALSLLLLVALVTTTHLDHDLAIKEDWHLPTEVLQRQLIDSPTAAVTRTSRSYVLHRDAVLVLVPPIPPTPAPTRDMTAVAAVMDYPEHLWSQQQEQGDPLGLLHQQLVSFHPPLDVSSSSTSLVSSEPSSSSSSLVEMLKPVVMEVALLMVFQVVGIPLLSKAFAICCNLRVRALLVSRLPWLAKLKGLASSSPHLKQIWKVTYHSSRPPLRMLRKAQKFIKKWYGPQQEQHRRRQQEQQELLLLLEKS